MNFRTYRATTYRVLRQLRADPRTIGLILGVPTILLVLLYYVYGDYPGIPGVDPAFPGIALTMLGILPMIAMFLVTSVAMQRERVTGTLERLWTTPLHRADLLLGYASAFAVMALVQSLILCGVAYFWLGVDSAGSPWILLIATLDSVVGVAFGLLTSAFARTEFQAVQFMPVVIGPQIFLCGLFVARDQLPTVLEWWSNILPMSYAVDALHVVDTNSGFSSDLGIDLLILGGFGVLALAVAAFTMPRRAA